MKKTVLLLFLSTLFFASCQNPKTTKPASYDELVSYIKSNDLQAFKEGFSDNLDVNHLIIDSSDKKYYTLLGFACKYKKEDFVKELLLKKATVNLGKSDDIYEYDALYVAIESQNDQATKLLLKNGAKSNSSYTEDGLSPLAFSCNFNNVENVKALLDNKASVNGNNLGEGYVFIPLIVAVNNEFEDIVKVLIEAGANPNLRNREDVSALSLAQSKNNSHIEKLLLKNTSDKASENTKILNVVFEKEAYVLMVKTEKKTYSIENLEFSGFNFKTVKLKQDGNLQLNFAHSSGSQIVGTAKFDEVEESFFLTNLLLLSADKNEESGNSKKCELKNLNENFKNIDEDKLFDRLTSFNCL